MAVLAATTAVALLPASVTAARLLLSNAAKPDTYCATRLVSLLFSASPSAPPMRVAV